VCVAVEGLFLDEPALPALRAAAVRSDGAGVDAVFLADGPLGDAVVLAAALGEWTTRVLLSVRVSLGPRPHRHPTVLAREMTTLDIVVGARSVLAFTVPFTEAVSEAIVLCKEMWSAGVAAGEGPHYPVAGAINRPWPRRPGGPPIALDLTSGGLPAAALVDLCDLVLVPADRPLPAGLPQGLDVCRIVGG
jgi:alkanesulfonate monooxygenase SsuD/methylene tetrahydromethanopterin reductase-like flavin-dependent oxidoreductase (luciferase family)